MKPESFEIYKKILKEQSGLVVTQDKTYLLESRLNPVAKSSGKGDLDALATALSGDKNLLTQVVEAMTTNETSFFRDNRPFDVFKDTVLPYMLENRANKKELRIWCAASSSGQEPYSLAMILDEMKDKLAGWKISILGTDISHDILEQARSGVYTQFEVQRGLPITMLMNYFTQDGEKWAINDTVKKVVEYRYFNLLEPMTSLGTFDVVFCRNVLIYFDEATKADILARTAKQMEKDGFLFLGGAETVIGITEDFKPIPDKRGLYGLSEGPHLTPAVVATRSGALAS
jgi:chemotaxis protein methyltransferase CheR